jgi:hypothetical protein
VSDREPGTTTTRSPYPALVLSGGNLETVLICSFCGRQEADEAKTLTWTTSVENGRKRVYCDACSRQHLRSMEGKLDSEFW